MSYKSRLQSRIPTSLSKSSEASGLKAAKGFALIEALIGMGVAAVVLLGFSTLLAQAARVNRANALEFRSSLWLRETIEVAKDLEQSNWSALNNPACFSPLQCHPEISGGSWVFVSGLESLDGGMFTRSLSTEIVYRDAVTNEIVATPGILDPDTKKVHATISWYNGFENRTMTLDVYVYNLP